jgi:hypothetical protein
VRDSPKYTSKGMCHLCATLHNTTMPMKLSQHNRLVGKRNVHYFSANRINVSIVSLSLLYVNFNII